jgi:guanylate kinase
MNSQGTRSQPRRRKSGAIQSAPNPTSQQALQRPPQRAPQPRQAPPRGTQQVTQQVPQRVPDRVPQHAPQPAPQPTGRRVPQPAQQRTPQQVQQRTSQQAQQARRKDAPQPPRAETVAATSPGTQPLLVLISAPSGSGKTTLCQQLLQARPGMTRAVTCTTRDPRQGEQDGIDYYFLDAGNFLKRVQAGNFLEHATVYSHSYGILKSEVLDKLRQGKDVLLNVDVQGAATIRARALDDPELRRALVTLFLTPSSITVLERRLRNRGTDAPEVIRKRLSVARQEIAQWRNFDYLVVSDTIQEDLRRTLAIVQAEKLRTSRVAALDI